MLHGTPRTPDSELRFPGENIDFTKRDFTRLLCWASDEGCSDIRMETGKRVTVQRHGRVIKVTKRALTTYEVRDAADEVYAADAMAHLKTRNDFNIAYEPGVEREWNDLGQRTRYRFRVNASLALQNGVDGAALVARALPTIPVDVDKQNVEPAILEACRPKNGMIVIAGATGEGKSTLASGLVMHELLDPKVHRVFNEYSAPIEYVYDGIEGPHTEIKQIEIGRHLESFHQGIRHAVRDNADVIIVGECRDSETMVAGIDASLANHRVVVTVHAGSIYETLQRMVSLCPVERRAEMTTALAQALRLVVNQRLLWSTNQTRTPVREHLVFDKEMRRLLGQNEPDKWPLIMESMAKALRTDFQTSIFRARDERRIDEAVFAQALRDLNA